MNIVYTFIRVRGEERREGRRKTGTDQRENVIITKQRRIFFLKSKCLEMSDMMCSGRLLCQGA